MNNEFNYEVQKILKNAEKEMKNLHHPYVGTEHLLLSLLNTERVANICKKYKLTYALFKQELVNVIGLSHKESEVILYTPLLRLVLDNALIISKNIGEEVNEVILMNSLLTSDDGIAIRLLMGMHIDVDALYNEIATNKSNTLNELGVNLNEKNGNVLVGRDEEIKNIMEVLLRKNKNNPILIGGAGVGKSAIVYELARRIKQGNVPEKLKKATIISVDMASLLSNTKYRGEFETRLNTIIKELKKNKNTILFIDEIHTIVRSGGGEGSIDAANILKPYLASDEIKVIGATTTNEYEKYIAKDKALSRRFASIMVREPNFEETIHILEGVRSLYEEHHHVKISDENIKDIVKLSDEYIHTNHHPDKALEVLDSVCSKVSLKQYENDYEIKCNEFLKNKDYKNALKVKKRSKRAVTNEITYEDICEVIECMTNMKLPNKKLYQIVSSSLTSKIIGQNTGPILELLKKKFVSNKVLGFTIRGEKGIGKSYTAKVIAESMGYNLIEIDMSLFSSSTSINRILGSDPGYVGYEDETLLDKVKYQPYSLLLLKNMEYCSPNVLHLFESILQNGGLKDNKGEFVNFNNSLIIMTTNIVNKSLGYNSEIKTKESPSIIDYQLIPKTSLLHIEKYKKVLPNIKEKTTFTEINKVLEESMYNDLISMV